MFSCKQTFMALILLLVTTSAFAILTEPERLTLLAQQFLSAQRPVEHMTAIALTVQSPHAAHAENIYVGTMDLTHKKTLNKNSLFQIGSIGKSFFAVILLKLASDPHNHFSINDPIDKYFPEYSNWHQISVKELLNMSSGIPDYFSDRNLIAAVAEHPYQKQNPRAWVNTMYTKSLLFSPGKKFNYSNTNYFLLGMLIEKMSGRTLAHEMNALIIKPYQLTHTYYVENKPNSALSKHLVHGYQNEEGFLDYIPRGTDVTQYSLSYLGAAGAIVSNSSDISIWIENLFTPGKVLTTKEFSQMTAMISESNGRPIKKLSLNDPDAFGLGIGVHYSAHLKTPIYVYQGFTFGYRAMYAYIPSKRLSIVITTNSSSDADKNTLANLLNKVGDMVV